MFLIIYPYPTVKFEKFENFEKFEKFENFEKFQKFQKFENFENFIVRMNDFKLGLADLKLVSYPKGLKSIKSKLSMADFKSGWLTLS